MEGGDVRCVESMRSVRPGKVKLCDPGVISNLEVEGRDASQLDFCKLIEYRAINSIEKMSTIKPRRRRRHRGSPKSASSHVGPTTDPFAFTDLDDPVVVPKIDPVSVVKQARKKKRAACKTKNKTTKKRVITGLFKTQQSSLLRSLARAKLESEEIERTHQRALKKIRKKT